MNKNENRRRKK